VNPTTKELKSLLHTLRGHAQSNISTELVLDTLHKYALKLEELDNKKEEDMPSLNASEQTQIHTVTRGRADMAVTLLTNFHIQDLDKIESAQRAPLFVEHLKQPQKHNIQTVLKETPITILDQDNNQFVLANTQNTQNHIVDQELLTQLLYILALATILGGLVSNILQAPAFIGYIAAGTLLGPNCFNIINVRSEIIMNRLSTDILHHSVLYNSRQLVKLEFSS